jgi:hypothetical protein
MSPEQIALVETTLQEVRPRLDDVAVQFYARLAAASPDVATTVTGDPASQRRTFTTELDAICRAIGDHAAFLAEVRQLGRLHRGLGVRAPSLHRGRTSAAGGAGGGPGSVVEPRCGAGLAARLPPDGRDHDGRRRHPTRVLTR